MAAVSLIADHPAIGEKIGRTGCRRFILTEFPFSVVYRDRTEFIEVVAVAHGSRRSGYLKPRLRDS